MTELEEKLLQSLKQLQVDYETQFSELHESLNNLASNVKLKQTKCITAALREQKSGIICLDCKHGKYSKRQDKDNQQFGWKFSCLKDNSQQNDVGECTHYEK